MAKLNIFALPLALISVTLTLILIISADSWLVSRYRHLNIERARKQLNSRDLKGAITSFDLASNQVSVYEELFSRESKILPTLNEIVNQVTPIEACNAESFKLALENFSNEKDPITLDMREELQSRVNSITDLEKGIATTEAQMRNYIALWKAPSEEFSSLLGLKALPNNQNLEIPHYTKGVLASLPKLDRLEDGIDTLIALRDAIAKAGGSVNLHGADVAAEFNERISVLRNDCEALVKPFEELKNDLEEHQRKINLVKQEAQLWCLKAANRTLDALNARYL